MRWIILLVSTVAFTALSAPFAHAHGGSFGHRYAGPIHAPTLACDCAGVDCPKCSAPGLAAGDHLSERSTQIEILERWGDVCRVRITTEFATEEDERVLEAHACVTMGPLLAITGGSVRANDEELVGVLREGRAARRDYLWERNRRKRDPLLVLRHGPGTVHLRVFPIRKGLRVRSTLEGFALAEAPDATGVRLYRTGISYLAVVPLTHPVVEQADLRDEVGGRAFLLIGRRACRELFPEAMGRTREIPGVDALHASIRGRGAGAVTDETALVALPKGSRAPADLFVGDPKDAPVVRHGGPPGLREPSDPVPPPPPPAAPTAVDVPTAAPPAS